MIHLAANTSLFNTKCTLSEWLQAMEEVKTIISDMNSRGATITKIRYLNEINEVTPCNVDRNKWFFRINGEDVESASEPSAFASRVESLYPEPKNG